MAQPPAVVVRTFKPVGQLQLHHLGEHARFHCVHCGLNAAIVFSMSTFPAAGFSGMLW